jgi:hypothetical protein
MSFQTFWNFIEELAAKPLPPAIDRSIMKSKSGTDQANLIMALNSFGLTDTEGTVQPMLTYLIEEVPADKRVAAFGDLLHGYYVGPLRVSAQNGTPADLNNVFNEDYPSIGSSDTRRKAITFFLHAARSAGIELSQHFPATRSGSGAPGAPKAKRASTRKKQQPNGADALAVNSMQSQQARGDTYTVELASGGSVSVVVSVNLFALTTEDRTFVIDLVDKLKGYPKAAQPPTAKEAAAS